MASMEANVLAMLKVCYGDKVESLLFRNSPVFSKIAKERVEGKSYNFPALAGFSGGVGGDYTKAVKNASRTGTTAQWAVEPGQIFGAVSFNAKEVLASKSNRGAFMRVADAKLFTSFDAIQKVLATALYGRGYGEVCKSGFTATTAIASAATFQITGIPEYAMMTFVPGMELELKGSITASTAIAKLTVQSANGSAIVVQTENSIASSAVASTDIICIAGSMNGETPLLPMGLAGWLPNVAKRTGSNWAAYADLKFFGVNRSKNQDALCGAYYDGSGTKETKDVAVQKLLRKVRRQGSNADIIILNDEDWADMAANVPTTNSYFTQTSSKGKKVINAGTAEMTAAFSTNYIENIYDDPFCPKGRFYILDSEKIKFISYSNADRVVDTGVAGNEPGTREYSEGDDVAAKPYGLLIDDLLTLQPGKEGVDGPSTVVGINVYGAFVITNPAKCGVGNFYSNSDANYYDIQAKATA